MYIQNQGCNKKEYVLFFDYRLHRNLIDFLFILLTSVLEAKMSLKQQHKEEIAPKAYDTCVPPINTYHL